MHEKEVAEIFHRRNMPVGTCSYSEVSFSQDERFRSVITTVVPYWFKPERPHNISIYAMLPDYHKIVVDILTEVCGELKKLFPDNVFELHADVSPVNEKKAAVLGGLGFIGKNTLLINEKCGSFLFIGDICTDAEIHIKNEVTENKCKGCDLCIKACPGNALSDGFCAEKCVSAITQKKGELTDSEKKILRNSCFVWGCDVCSLVCPHNKYLETSAYAEKYKDRLIYNIDSELLDGLSNREFKRKFNDRAFAWRGISVLRRNLEILECKE